MHSRSRQSVPAVALASLQPTRSQHTMWILRLVPYLRIPIHIHGKRNDGPSSNQVAETSAAKTQSCESHFSHWEQQAKVVSTTTLWTKPYAHTKISTSGYSVEPEHTQRRMIYAIALHSLGKPTSGPRSRQMRCELACCIFGVCVHAYRVKVVNVRNPTSSKNAYT